MIAITSPNIAMIIHNAKNTTIKKKTLVRRLIYLAVISEMDLPSLRMDIIRALKS